MTRVTLHNLKAKMVGDLVLLDLTEEQKQAVNEGKVVKGVSIQIEVPQFTIDLERELKGGEYDEQRLN